VVTDEEYEALEYERRMFAYSFHRTEVRKAKLKRPCDCGHWIDGSEPYRYCVWRTNDMPRGTIQQRTDCEFCARADNRY
jgi:hypothetical protein